MEADQVAPALVGITVATRVGRERERRLLLGEFGAGVEVVRARVRRMREAQPTR
ncbi:hypothetical protein [Streptomyces sp. NPDC007905]|uniref:hypothetical protein n=1 Tax=Streptomyces sp. NPDC007905 TaxID=3364788 RepID=UPI0036E722F6